MRGKFIHVGLSLLIFGALSMAFVGLVGRPGPGARAATAAGKADECGEQCFEEGDDAAPVLGVALPIPVSNWNQGGVEGATENLTKTRELTSSV